MTTASTRLIGAHVSAAGGVDKAIERAAAIGCNCVQVFSGSPRVWARSPLSQVDNKKVYSKQQELHVSPIITHSLYLVNFASENPELVTKSSTALLYDLQFDSLVKGAGVVLHIGSHQGRGWEAVRDDVRDRLAAVLAQAPVDCHLLLENAAGQKGKIGGDLHELQWLIAELKDERVGWCLDTCHAWAAGLALDALVDQMAELGLLATLKCIHVNGSRDEFGSGRDRHANLGEGLLSDALLVTVLTDERISHIPLILEVPGQDNLGPDEMNVTHLKTLIS